MNVELGKSGDLGDHGGDVGLAERVAALRQRLEAMGLSPVKTATLEPSPGLKRLDQIHDNLTQLKRQNSRMETALVATPRPRDESEMPRLAPARPLTHRARNLLLAGRDLLEQLKELARILDEPHYPEELATAYQETLTMAEVAVRSLHALPETAGDQLRVCDGVDAIFHVIAGRSATMRGIVERKQAEIETIDQLADLLSAIHQGKPVEWKRLEGLAEKILEERDAGLPLRLLTASAQTPARFVAAHSLNAAQVIARVGLQPEWASQPLQPVVAALVHDAGMLATPGDLLAKPGPITDEQKADIEKHAELGASAIERLVPGEGWLADAVRAHHERLDGTGYPKGLRAAEIPKLGRLLAVCDTYAALSADRPHRAALAPRTALTETLLDAEKGRLDANLAEGLLELSFYPVGTVVELEDGVVGVVAATNLLRGSVATPSRPVVQLLEAQGKHAWPRHLNLAQCSGRHIVRGLTPDECRTILAETYWELL